MMSLGRLVRKFVKVIGSEESKRSGYWVEQNIWILQFHKKLAGITSLFR